MPDNETRILKWLEELVFTFDEDLDLLSLASIEDLQNELGDDISIANALIEKTGILKEEFNRRNLQNEEQAEQVVSELITQVLVKQPTSNPEPSIPVSDKSFNSNDDTNADLCFNIISPMDGQAPPNTSANQKGIPNRAFFTSRRLATYYRLTQATLLIFDTIVLSTVAFIVLASQHFLPTNSIDQPIPLFAILACIPLFLLAYTGCSLYEPVALRPEHEIFSYLKANLTIILALSIPIAFLPNTQLKIVWFSLAIPLLLFIIPLFRVLTRIVFSRFPWWGVSAFVIAKGDQGLDAIKILRRNPEMGIKPVALVQDDLILDQVSGVPVLPSMMLYHVFARTHDLPYAIVGLDKENENAFLDNHSESPIFQHILLTRQNDADLLSFIVPQQRNTPRLKIKTSALNKRIKNSAKRIADIGVASILLILLSPVYLFLSLLIKLNIQGPLFNRLELLGKNGKRITVYKFRSMHLEDELAYYNVLNKNPELRQIYEMLHQFPDNAAMTRLGRMMRRFNLDKLPQLWNVVCGDLSLVGPRPYMPGEIMHMRGNEQSILDCKPGITGLWQVSGQNRLSMDERMALDLYYCKNNSFELDLYIFLKTILQVFNGPKNLWNQSADL